jgi:hypothetical protein
LLPGIWTSLTSHRSISRHIARMFCIRFVLLRRPELTAWLTGLPRTRVAINGVGRAQRQAFVLHLTPPATSQRHTGGIAAYPLLATRRLHERCRGIATKAARGTGNGLGFHPILRHHVSLSHGVGMTTVHRARFPGAPRRGALSPLRSSSSYRGIAWCLRRPVLTRERMRSPWSTVRHSRQQWQHKATQRAEQNRYWRKQ